MHIDLKKFMCIQNKENLPFPDYLLNFFVIIIMQKCARHFQNNVFFFRFLLYREVR